MTASRKTNKRKTATPAKGRVRHQAVTRAVSRPSAMSKIAPSSSYSMSHQGPICRVRGHEFLCQVVITTGQHLAAVYDMNPATWVGSRLVNLARSYEVYRFNKVKLIYVPSVGTTTSGAVSIGFETDPNEPIPAESGFYQRSMSNIYASLGPVWAEQSTSYQRPVLETRWWHASMEESDRRQTSQLMAYAVTDASTTSLGWLMAEYEIDFMYPELEFPIGQENFSGTTFIGSSPSIAPGAPLEATFTGASGVRLMETIYTGLGAINDLRAGNTNFNLTPGQNVFWAYDDVAATFRAYRTESGARTNTGLITKITAALAANALAGVFRTRVISRSTAGY